MLKKLVSLGLAVAVSCSAVLVVSAKENTIPATMPSGAIVTYDSNLNATIEYDKSVRRSIVAPETDIGSKADLLAEEAFFQKVKEETKDNPVIVLPDELPAPTEGMVVVYGTDGHINRIYQPETNISPFASPRATPPSNRLPVGSRLPIGTYQYGANNNIVTIGSNYVAAEGRFTVFRDGVNGSGPVGSSGKVLGAGDVATKQSVDNPYHNTALSARATDTDVLKTVYKNDQGGMPDAVLDVYFWGFNNLYFGYAYSDSLSFPGRYYYQY